MKSLAVVSLLRVVAGVSQLLILLILGKYLVLSDFGAYTLFVIYIGYAAIISGFSFHNYVLREMSSVPSSHFPSIFFAQAVFTIFSTSITVLAVCLGMGLDLIQIERFSLAFVLLIATVFNNQNESFLMGAAKPIWASASLILRVSWIYFLLGLLFFGDNDLVGNEVYYLWAFSEVICAIVISFVLYRSELWPRKRYRVDFTWIKRGILAGAQFTIIGFSLTLILSFPRVFLGEEVDSSLAGIFHLYFIVCVFGVNLIEAAYYSIAFPKLAKRYSHASFSSLVIPKISTFTLFFLIWFCYSCVVYFAFPFILDFVSKPELANYQYLLIFTFFHALIYSFSRIFHYEIFAAGGDYLLLIAYVVSMCFCFLVSIFFIPKFGLYGAGAAQVLSSFFMLLAMIVALVYLNVVSRKFGLAADGR